MLSSETLDEAAGEQAGAAGALEGAFVPAVLSLLVHEDDVAFLQLDLGLALWRVRHHHAVPAARTTPDGGSD